MHDHGQPSERLTSRERKRITLGFPKHWTKIFSLRKLRRSAVSRTSARPVAKAAARQGNAALAGLFDRHLRTS
jgi:hypothetical protein